MSELNRYNLDAPKRLLEFTKLNHVGNISLAQFTIVDGEEALICLSSDGKGGIP